ncbi:ATP-binding protein [Longitalea luteola]|uniref:ATP-binding protein n=1 Tax=Longitalea luteola TaxID=2812563 RepID=UPI001A970860|nr:tetratricopeptide repeat-containing sensor histidine kinase [Longitalea luteola]
MKKLAIIFSILTGFAAHAQQQAFIDSLLLQLGQAKEDTFKTKLLYKISESYTPVNTQEGMRYAEMGMEHARKMKWKKGIAAFHISLGNLLSNTGSYRPAIEHYQQALAVNKEINNKKGMVSALLNIGGAYFDLRDYTKATDLYFQSLQLAEAIHDSSLIALNYVNIAKIFFGQSHFAKALDYGHKSLQLYEALQDELGIATALEVIGNIYNQQKEYAKAEAFYLKALKIYEDAGNLLNIATIYSQLGVASATDYRKAISYELKAHAIWDTLSPAYPIAITNIGNLGTAYLDIARYDTLHIVQRDALIPDSKQALLQKAEVYLRRSIALGEQTGDVENRAYFTGVLAETQFEQGRYKEAYANFRTYHDLYDSIYSQENKNNIAAIEGQRELAIKDKQIAINQLALDNQKKQGWFLITGLCLLLIIGALLYVQSRTRKKTNTTLLLLNNQLDEANKIKTKFFSILSHDLRSPVSNLINFLHLQREAPDLMDKQTAASYTQKITASAENLLETMEGLLLWCKGQMENFKPQIRNVPVSELFADIEKHFADGNSVRITFDQSPDMYISTDEHYLKTIMRNLTGNAIKAVANTTNATVEWKAWEQNGNKYLSITDNGGGATDQQLEALFNDASPVGIKSGLGLHLVRDLAKTIACSISVHTAPGKGTAFQLSM